MSKINLIPEVRQQKLKVEKSNATATSVAVVVVIATVAIILGLAAYAGVLTAQKKDIENKKQSTQEKLDTMKDLEATVSSLELGLSNIKGIIEGSKSWNNFLVALEKNIPSDVQIVGMTVNANDVTLSLRGKEVKSIDRFIGSFSNAKNDKDTNLFTKVTVDGYSKKDDGKVSFESKLSINEAAGLW